MNLSTILSILPRGASAPPPSPSYVNATHQYLAESMVASQWKRWTSANRGGVDQTTITASIAGTTMTVTSASADTLGKGHFITGSGVSADTRIVQQLTGSPGGTGTYQVDKTQTLSSRSLLSDVKLPRTLANFDGGVAWASDAVVAGNVSDSGGVGAQLVQAFTASVINTFDGRIVTRAGGHNAGMDGSVLVTDLLAGPGCKFRVMARSGKVRPWVNTWPAWLQDSTTISAEELGTTAAIVTVNGTAGTQTLTAPSAVAEGLTGPASMVSGDSFIGGVAGIPMGAYVTGISMSGSSATITISQPLTADVSGALATIRRGAYISVESSIENVSMPHACQHYFGNYAVPGSSKVLVSGGYMGGRNYAHNLGGGWIFDPSQETSPNKGVLGPLQMAAGATHNKLARLGFAGPAHNGGSGIMGALAGSDVTGSVYLAGCATDSGRVSLWRYNSVDTAPSLTKIADAGYNFAPPSVYVTNAVVCPDPRLGGAARMFFMDDAPGINSQFDVFSDIDGTPGQYFACTWPTRPTFAATSDSGRRAFAYCWNSDRQVMACHTGTAIYEFTLTWNGTTYVSSAWTNVTAGATGDVPTKVASEYDLMPIAYFPAPYRAYAVSDQYFNVRFFRRD